MIQDQGLKKAMGTWDPVSKDQLRVLCSSSELCFSNYASLIKAYHFHLCNTTMERRHMYLELGMNTGLKEPRTGDLGTAGFVANCPVRFIVLLYPRVGFLCVLSKYL